MRSHALLLPALLFVGCNPPAEVVRDDELRTMRAGAETVVVAYSRSGHTARAARAMAEAMGADYVRIQGRGDEGDSFFKTPSWRTRVALRPAAIDVGPYRRVVIATPIWYWRPAAPAMTLVATHELRGKEVVLLYTFEGGVRASALEAWRAAVEERGGRVVRVIGIDRKRLAPGETIEARARAITRELGTR